MFHRKPVKTINDCAVIDSIPASSLCFRPAAPLDSFMFEEHLLEDGTTSVRFHDDVYMLFNQQRLDRMTQEYLLNYINSMPTIFSSLSSVRKKLTDSQLLQFIKSRYIQAPSDLQRWSKYLEMVADSELSCIKDAASVSPSEDASSDDSSSGTVTQ